MAKPYYLSHMKEFSINRLFFFLGIDYSYCNTKMTQFLKSIDNNLYEVIKTGLHIPTKIENEVTISKPSKKMG